MKVLRAIGLEEATRDIAFRPEHQLSRDWDTGHVNLDYPFGDVGRSSATARPTC